MIENLDDRFDVFLSHTSDDKAAFIEPICERLRNDFRLNAFYDKSNLPAGGDFRNRIRDAMGSSCCVACFCSASPRKEFFNSEIGMAFNREGALGRRDGFMFPVLLPGFDQQPLHDLLKGRTWVDLSKGIQVTAEDQGTDKDPLWRLAEAIKKAVERNAAELNRSGFESHQGLHSQVSIQPRDLAILCDRRQQAMVIENDLYRFRQSDDHRPILAVIRGSEKQLPHAFVDRVTYETLPQFKGFNVYSKKILHEVTLQPSQQISTELMQNMTRSLVVGCEKAGISVSGSQSLSDLVRCIAGKNCACVVQVRFDRDARVSMSNCVQQICAFYSQEEFSSLTFPLVICALMLDGETQSVSAVAVVGKWLRGIFSADKHEDPNSLDIYRSRISVVHPPALDDVNGHDVAAWTEHPQVKAFDPDIAYRNFGMVYQTWQSEFGKCAAPMADAVEDLNKFLAQVNRT